MKRCALLILGAILLTSAAPRPDFRVMASYPHDTAAFTEGLFLLNGSLYESTGQKGVSDIREVRIKDGKVLRRVAIDPRFFGEGIAPWGGEIISLTWRGKGGWRWRISDFQRMGAFGYTGEGWGLTQDGRNIIMSDGTSELRFMDPATMTERHRVSVSWQGQPVVDINELEYVKGEVLANIWHDSRIARIEPATGVVKGWIDLAPLVRQVGLSDPEAVANGIAYDAKRDRLYVTGKNWPKLFEIKLR